MGVLSQILVFRGNFSGIPRPDSLFHLSWVWASWFRCRILFCIEWHHFQGGSSGKNWWFGHKYWFFEVVSWFALLTLYSKHMHVVIRYIFSDSVTRVFFCLSIRSCICTYVLLLLFVVGHRSRIYSFLVYIHVFMMNFSFPSLFFFYVGLCWIFFYFHHDHDLWDFRCHIVYFLPSSCISTDTQWSSENNEEDQIVKRKITIFWENVVNSIIRRFYICSQKTQWLTHTTKRRSIKLV